MTMFHVAGKIYDTRDFELLDLQKFDWGKIAFCRSKSKKLIQYVQSLDYDVFCDFDFDATAPEGDIHEYFYDGLAEDNPPEGIIIIEDEDALKEDLLDRGDYVTAARVFPELKD